MQEHVRHKLTDGIFRDGSHSNGVEPLSSLLVAQVAHDERHGRPVHVAKSPREIFAVAILRAGYAAADKRHALYDIDRSKPLGRLGKQHHTGQRQLRSGGETEI